MENINQTPQLEMMVTYTEFSSVLIRYSSCVSSQDVSKDNLG